MKRQSIRKLLMIITLLLFPIIIYYMSPYLIVWGASQGIIVGSFLVFCLQFVLGIVFGRGFCSYVCPMGGLQECLFMANDKRSKIGARKYIKYAIWVVWIALIVLFFIMHGKIEKVDPFFMMEYGISITEAGGYIIYYIVILVVVIPAIIHGKRAFCHYFCWMAPFMVLGIKVRDLFHLPGLHLKAEQEKCISCKQCTKHCPMSLDVDKMVKDGQMQNMECILCGECVDHCPKKAIHYQMRRKD